MKRFDAVIGSGFESELKNLLTKMKQQDICSPETNRIEVVNIMDTSIARDDRRKRLVDALHLIHQHIPN